ESGDTESGDTESGDTESGDTESGEIAPGEIVPVDSLLSDSEPLSDPVLEPLSGGAVDPTGSDVAASKPAPPFGEPPSGTRGDLHLLRQSQALRIRCAAAVLVPFVIFTVVLVAIGRTDVYLIWLWIPTVLAGVLVGAFLDGAHRKARSAVAAAPTAAAPAAAEVVSSDAAHAAPAGSVNDD
ncbi:MAG: hypothetical protein ABI429_03670, partial [Jatrophihabitantaceae bacterium]